nr:hypothetical protein [uncultured Psychroserpens sp.]
MSQEHRQAFNEYTQLIDLALKLENHIVQSDIINTPRIEISRVCLAKMIIQCTTLLKLLPHSETNYDISMFLATGRSIFELSNNCFFYGAQSISQEEKEFRLQLFNFISKKERKRPLTQLNTTDKDFDEWLITDGDLKSDRAKICNHPLFSKLIIENKFQGFDSLVNCLDKKNKYNSILTIAKERNLDMSFIHPMYSINSIFLHNSPAAISHQILKLKGELENEENDLKNAIVKATTSFSLMGLTIWEISETYVPNFKKIINKEELEIISNYSNNLKNR